MPYTSSYPGMKLRFRSKAGQRNFAARRIQSAYRRRRPKTQLIKRVVQNMEPFKYITNSLTTTAGSSWSTILNLSNIPFTTAESPHTRNSTKIQLKGFQMSLRCEVAAGDTSNSIRVALVRGRRAGSLNNNEIAYDYLASGDDYHLPFNQKFVDVIWSKTFQIQEIQAGAVYPPYREYEKYFKLNHICKFTESTTDVTTQPYNNTSLYLVCCSDSSVLPNPRLSGQSRISYKDLD